MLSHFNYRNLQPPRKIKVIIERRKYQGKTATRLSGNNGHGPPPRRKAHALSGGEGGPKGPSDNFWVRLWNFWLSAVKARRKAHALSGGPKGPSDNFWARLWNIWLSAVKEVNDAPIVVMSGLIYTAVQIKGAIDDVDKRQAVAKIDLEKQLELLKKDQELAALRNQQALKDTLFDLSYQSEYVQWRDKRREALVQVEKEKLGWKK